MNDEPASNAELMDETDQMVSGIINKAPFDGVSETPEREERVAQRFYLLSDSAKLISSAKTKKSFAVVIFLSLTPRSL